MSTASNQVAQPVPFFYGLKGAGSWTQELTSGFDYVITTVSVATQDGAGGSNLVLSDENHVPIAWFIGPSPYSGQQDPLYVLLDMPIGPRTALNFTLAGYGAYIYVGGYALLPPTTLSV